MEKIYNKTQWENSPSTNTPINETNLNNIENGVDALDDRVVELSNTKSNVDWVQLQKSGDKIAEITIDGVKRTVYAKHSSGGGGGGGTTDYEDLDNKPKINNVELNGNKTLSDLGINAESVGALPKSTIIPTTLAELAEDTTHRTVTDAEKTKWNEGGGGSSVSWNQIVTSGTKIAEVSVDGNKTDVYAPNGGSGGGGTASDITYDNSESGLEATNLQDATDELKENLTQFETSTNTNFNKLKGNSVLKTVSCSANLTLQANGAGQVLIPFTRPSGYIPVMATPYGLGAWSWCWTQCMLEASNNRVNAIIKSTSEAGTFPVSAFVLCIKEDLVS